MYNVNNLNKVLVDGEVNIQILHDISLTIDEKAFVTILGPSGSGKTTLLNVLSGLDRDYEGTVFFYDEGINQFSESHMVKYRKEYISFVFQQYHLLPTLTAKENVEIATQLSMTPFHVEDILEKVQMLDHANKYPNQLSGGQKQRVAIARAVAKKPKVIFCDEPTGALDSTNAKIVMELLLDLNKSFGITIIMVTHNEEYAKLGNHVIRMRDGQIVMSEKVINPVSTEQLVW